jgi:hypothetical protein
MVALGSIAWDGVLGVYGVASGLKHYFRYYVYPFIAMSGFPLCEPPEREIGSRGDSYSLYEGIGHVG